MAPQPFRFHSSERTAPQQSRVQAEFSTQYTESPLSNAACSDDAVR